MTEEKIRCLECGTTVKMEKLKSDFVCPNDDCEKQEIQWKEWELGTKSEVLNEVED
jgi:predicted RNA-binding Zn-ribbon protein involved in translation (DUF1610 family)